ncbi:HEAT repeat domain-containing protein [Streptomyces showdoensis]|uniref:HEAT repeat-containing protein n=1 Tax=Streptomyces showdoensis TaxID=68268 RepID=A0A2P2GU58_STREW|nr:HEAT repeat domain-containing protein [Streptomyces showdoensis]KKZ75030.1 hypothetical protein VO63_04245 [Streptomyces showdoensis]
MLNRLYLGDVTSDAPSPFERRALELFLDWAAQEEHPDVLTAVLHGLGEHEDPRIEPLGLRFLAHSAPSVRTGVIATLSTVYSERSGRTTFTPEGLNALLVLAQDTGTSVRQAAGYQLAHSLNPDPAVGDTLAGLLDDEDQHTRIWVAFGLAVRDDPRCVEGADKVGPVDDRPSWSWILDAPARYEERRKARGGPTSGE